MGFSLDQFLLDGKVAIVTGAGGRGNSIGRAYALGLASAGAKVVVADLNGEGAQRVADEIKTLGNEAIAVQVDITSRDSVSAMAEAAIDTNTTGACRPCSLSTVPTSTSPRCASSRWARRVSTWAL